MASYDNGSVTALGYIVTQHLKSLPLFS